MMHYQKERCEILGDFLLEHNETVRGAAKYFSISKSTVHKDVTVRLRFVNPAMFGDVRALLTKNKAERHLRGGEATRMKYKR